jgi:hypothetical protein
VGNVEKAFSLPFPMRAKANFCRPFNVMLPVQSLAQK